MVSTSQLPSLSLNDASLTYRPRCFGLTWCQVPVIDRLKDGPDRLDAVGVDVAPDVLALAVGNDIVPVLVDDARQRPVGRRVVGVDGRAAFHAFLDQRNEGGGPGVSDVFRLDLAAPLLDADHGFLADRAASRVQFPGFVLVAFLPADVGLVDLDSFRELEVAAAAGFADTVQHVPGGAVLDAEFLGELHGADALAGGEDGVDGVHPMLQVGLGGMEAGARRDREMPTAGLAPEMGRLGWRGRTDIVRTSAVRTGRLWCNVCNTHLWGHAMPESMLPEEVREIRKALGLTQTEAGAVLGGGPRAFAKYEAGAVEPSASLVKLLRLLEGNPSALAAVGGKRLKPRSALVGPFACTGEDVMHLREWELPPFLRSLLHAEAEANGLPADRIRVNEESSAADGGEDAAIQWEDGPDRTAYLNRAILARNPQRDGTLVGISENRVRRTGTRGQLPSKQ